MAGLIALMFMDVGQAPQHSRILALAGLFWVCILIGLTSVDFLARQDFPAPLLTRP